MKYVSPYETGNEENEYGSKEHLNNKDTGIKMAYNAPNAIDKNSKPAAKPIVKSSNQADFDPNRWADPLYARGFTDKQIRYFNIRPGTTIFHDPVPGETAKDFEIVESDPPHSSGWIYPIYYPQSNVSLDRIKYFPGKSDGPKARSPKGFRMPGGKHPPFYVPHQAGLERLKKAIAANKGLLFGVEGEPDNWAMDVMGISNVTAFFGWTNVPENLYSSLRWLGVKRFIYITDNDEAGTRGANNVWNALFYTDISFSLYQTPSTYNGRPTKDTNDILQAISYSPEEFSKYLNEVLPANFKLEFEEPGRSRYDGFAENKEFLGVYNMPDIARDVIEVLNSTNKTAITRFDNDGWSNNTQCPMADPPHESDDKKPAFGVNIQGGGCNCFKCGSHSIIAVAKKVGLDINQYRFDKLEPVPPPEGMKSIERITSDVNNEMGSFFSVAKARGTSVDYVHSDPNLYVRPRRKVMKDIIKRAEGKFEEYLSFSVPWPMDDPQFTKLGGYCTLLPAGKLVQLISYTGGGKCVIKSEYINSENGMIEIGDLKPDNVEGFVDETGGIFYPMRIGIKTPTGMQYTSHFYDGGIKPVKRVQTRFGYKVTGTYNHPLLVLKSGGITAWKTLSEIEAGDYIAVQRHESVFGNDDKIPLYQQNIPGSIHLNIPSRLDDEMAYVMGILVGDGGLTGNNGLTVTKYDNFILDSAMNWFTSLGLNPRKSVKDVKVSSMALMDWLKSIGLSGYSYEKSVPDMIMRASKENVRAFLSGLFDTDGSGAYKAKAAIQYCSTSEKLARQVHILLLQFGIISSLRFKPNSGRGSWVIDIRGIEAKKFFDDIGFRLERKQATRQYLRENPNTNVDLIPYLPYAKGMNYGEHYTDYKYTQGIRKPSYPKLAELAGRYPQYEELLEPNYFWDEVVVAEDAGMEHVYDLTVPEGHAFVANGIVNHNTTMMRSLEFAFNEIGIHTLLWSPEFDDMEHGDSTVQLVSGVSSIAAMKNDQYYIDKMNNVDISEFGTVFEEYERIKTLEAANQVISMPGESYLATQFSSDVYNMLLMFESICDYALAEGNEVQVVIVDYAQLMQAPHGEKDWDINKSVLAFKEWCNFHGPYVSPRDGVKRMRRRKVGIFTSQATKAAARAVQTGEQPYLTPEDAMEVRPDWANLILSTKMGGNFSYNPQWGHSREYEIYVCKNSKGDKREYNEAETGPVKMILNLKNLRIMYQSERLMRQKARDAANRPSNTENAINNFKNNQAPQNTGTEENKNFSYPSKPLTPNEEQGKGAKPGYMVNEHGEILPIPLKKDKSFEDDEPSSIYD
jgi:intein/homing endonuclease